MPMKLVELEGVSRSNAYQIPPELLQPGENPRVVADKEIAELADSILLSGQLVPVIVYTDSEGDPHILDGNRRVAAIRWINLYKQGETLAPLKVRCEVFKGPDAYEASVAATHKRKPFSPIDLAHIMQTLEEKGKTRKQIATLLECSESLISRTLSLNALPPEVQKDIHKGNLSADFGYELAKMPAETRERELETARHEAQAAAPETKRTKRETKRTKRETKAATPETAPEISETAAQNDEPAQETKSVRVTRASVRKARQKRAEKGEQVEMSASRTRKETYEMFAEMAKDETVEEPIQKYASTMLKYMDGEVGSRAVLNRLRELKEENK